MKRELIVTQDGSNSISIPEMDVTYHSKHGAVQESMHVFINAGLRYKLEQNEDEISVFEVGFGTGLNALLTCNEALAQRRKIFYTTVEPFPISTEMAASLNFEDSFKVLDKIHSAAWNTPVIIDGYFTILKLNMKLNEVNSNRSYDLVYFDAFSPQAQPELWTHESFAHLISTMKPEGVLTTYCSKSIVRRTMTGAGFRVTKLAGPHGKREMVRAFKD
ncbi:MAG: SAM-dependent methyltransferase [Chitinophagaceae bacterium]|nr:MAG: SAM-dependent methyltransferase [Chitinophagaceae bacterium]